MFKTPASENGGMKIISGNIRIRSWRKVRPGLLLMAVAGAVWLPPSEAQCRISFDALQNDGYGMGAHQPAPAQRPHGSGDSERT